jgi:hypothetical protein
MGQHDVLPTKGSNSRKASSAFELSDTQQEVDPSCSRHDTERSCSRGSKFYPEMIYRWTFKFRNYSAPFCTHQTPASTDHPDLTTSTQFSIRTNFIIQKTRICKVGVVVKAAGYKPAGGGFRLPMVSLEFFSDIILPVALWPCSKTSTCNWAK